MPKSTISESPEPSTADQHLQFIVIPPKSSDTLFNDSSDVLETLPLRKKGFNYQNTTEDKWVDEQTDYSADIIYQFDSTPKHKFVYVPHNGRLYFGNTVLEIADIIRVLQANESSKIIK